MAESHFVRVDPNPIPIDSLSPPDYDVREYRTDEDIDNTAKTLEREGQIMPILVGQKKNGVYPILDGNHRYFAAKRLGWESLDAIQTEAGVDEDEVQIIANVSRLELSPSEKLSVFDYLLGTLDVSVSDAADRVGIDRSQVHRYKKIMDGYGEIKQFYMQDELGVHACYQLNQVPDRDRAVDIAETAVREGYHDADVVEQAKFARGEEEAQNEMRGAGTEQNTQNIQQVKRNAKELGELDPIDSQGVRDAQVAPDEGQPPEQGQASQNQAQEPQGPPCMACGKPMEAGALTQVKFHPEMAQELGVDELRFGAQCTGKLIEWWQQRQANVDVDEAEGGEGGS